MKPRLLLSLFILTLTTGCGLNIAAQKPKPPNIREILLHYIPPNEPGAPHDVEWLVDHASYNGGYYGSGHLPGTIRVTRKTVYGVPLASGSDIAPYGNSVSQADWKINGLDYRFWVFRRAVFDFTKSMKPTPSKSYDVIAENNWAMYAFQYPFFH